MSLSDLSRRRFLARSGAIGLGLLAGSISRLVPTALASSGFASTPVYNKQGVASAVYLGGSLEDLLSAASLAGADSVWVQDRRGVFRVLYVNGPTFLNQAFLSTTTFPLPATAVTLVRSSSSPGSTGDETAIEFRYGGEVSPAERELIEAAAYEARDFLADAMGYARVAGRVYVYNDPSDSIQANYSGGWVRVNVGEKYWPIRDQFDKRKIVAHEFSHRVLTNNASGIIGTYPGRYFLAEGLPEYAASRYIIERGYISDASWLDLEFLKIRSSPVPLGRIDELTYPARGAEYALFCVGVTYLVGEGRLRTVAALNNNFRRRGYDDMPGAFEETFGETIESFASRFEAYREANGIT